MYIEKERERDRERYLFIPPEGHGRQAHEAAVA